MSKSLVFSNSSPNSSSSSAPTPRLTHLALHVEDIEACIRFYQYYCGMKIFHERYADNQRIVWMAEPGREKEFIFVMMDGGQDLQLEANYYRHFGFAMPSKESVSKLADLAHDRGYLVWPPKQEPYPVGYYCGLRDPNGNYVEFSYGQPLGPGAVK